MRQFTVFSNELDRPRMTNGFTSGWFGTRLVTTTFPVALAISPGLTGGAVNSVADSVPETSPSVTVSAPFLDGFSNTIGMFTVSFTAKNRSQHPPPKSGSVARTSHIRLIERSIPYRTVTVRSEEHTSELQSQSN